MTTMAETDREERAWSVPVAVHELPDMGRRYHIAADEHVRAVLINIFGGIVRCDMVARGVVEAARKLGISVPVVVRLEGTNVEEGQRVIRDSGLNFTVANGMRDAAEKVVALAA